MKLAIKTCTLDMPYEEMLDFCVSQKIAAIEIGTGNWSGAPHCDLDLLVSDKTAREKWYDAMRAKGLELCALNCSGNPLAYEKEMDVTKRRSSSRRCSASRNRHDERPAGRMQGR